MSETINYIEISVPADFDSMSTVSLSGRQYYIRFTYNDSFDYWTFGLYDTQMDPVVEGIKIVPGTPLNIFCPSSLGLPDGFFIALSNLDRIGKYDFRDEKATFNFVPNTQE